MLIILFNASTMKCYYYEISEKIMLLLKFMWDKQQTNARLTKHMLKKYTPF